jgi:hypothetical protein
MKLIYCDKCHEVIQLRYELKSCTCGDISGKYLEDGRIAEIHLDNNGCFKTTRVLGFPNSVRYGNVREGICWSFDWLDPYLRVCFKKKQYKPPKG